MATASDSLFRMTVPVGKGTDSGQDSGILMPKLQYRFRASFINFGVRGGVTADLTKNVMDITRPQLSFEEVTLDVYNSKVYLAGKHSWSETTVNIRDDAGGKVSALIGQQLQKQMDFVEQASAASGQDYKFQINYEVLDGGRGIGENNILETWELYGCFIKTANYNNMDYKSNEPATIQLQIRFDNAIQSPLVAGLGTAVGRALGGGKDSSVTGIG